MEHGILAALDPTKDRGDLIWFRPQRGGLAESMRELVELVDVNHLRRHVRRIFDAEIVAVNYYAMDTRLDGWIDTCAVVAQWPDNSRTVCGFVNRKIEL